MSDQDTTQPGKSRRSPGHPSIDLKTALERTLDLYRVAPKHPVPLAVAADEWGYSAKSSSNLITAAALKRYGLVRDVGSSKTRQLALTDEGRELAFLDPERGESPRWVDLVREAALRPKIHRQVLDHFDGPLPDDRVVLQYLIFEVGFADEPSAKSFLRVLRSTLDFAGLDGAGGAAVGPAAPGDDPGPLRWEPQLGTDQGDSAQQSRDGGRDPVQGPGGGERGFTIRHDIPRPPEPSVYEQFRADRQLVQIPYSPGQWAALQAPFPMTERDWDSMIAMLQAMKPGLVAERDADESDHFTQDPLSVTDRDFPPSR